MDKRYQVFVSSTFTDLQEERQEIIQALLELDCIPAGMELFPAADEDQWSLIKRVIDDCDYYLVIIGGRYGSIAKDGKSYTQMEYEYAVSKGKPVIAFLHKDPSSIVARKSEETPEGRHKLAAFREIAQKKMCRHWESPEELGSVVSRSIVKLMQSNPAVGWVRADLVPDESAAKEILKLKRQVEDLQAALEAALMSAPTGTSDLASGSDEVELVFIPSVRRPEVEVKEYGVATTWNEVFSVISPLMIDKATEQQLMNALRDHFWERLQPRPSTSPYSITLANANFQKLKVQFRALGMIEKDTSQKSLKDTATYWTLTPYGDSLMMQANAVKSKREGSTATDMGKSVTS